MNKTMNYKEFVFRDDNRSKINKSHIEKLKRSIQQKNLLELRPIIVNEKMEVIDGQHRLLAAQDLGVEIYYIIEEKLTSKDVVLMNISKQWCLEDFLNYYCRNEHPEYIKLRDFLKKERITLNIALALQLGKTHKIRDEFKLGNYQYVEIESETIDVCWQTLELIKRRNGASQYLQSARFWMGMVNVFSHPKFEKEKWFVNLNKMVDDCGARITIKNYIKMLLDIYNYRNNERITIVDDKSYDNQH